MEMQNVACQCKIKIYKHISKWTHDISEYTPLTLNFDKLENILPRHWLPVLAIRGAFWINITILIQFCEVFRWCGMCE